MTQEFFEHLAKHEINILIGNVSESDKELFFGPIYDFDVFHQYDYGITLGQILVDLGIMKSMSEAKRNDWNRYIPPGWSEYKIGKRNRKYIYVLKVNQ